MPLYKFRNIIFLCLYFVAHATNAQYYNLGQDPASVKWNIIKTGHFKIIFPEGLEAQAQHIANGFEQVYEPLSADMKIKPVKIPVVLHNRAILSNAEVPWAPKRIEFFMTPAQDDYAQPWVDQLMLHEYRHVVQYSKITQGFTKALYYIFGQQATAAVIGTFVPLWYIEGDAVCTETDFSTSGRGRLPSFSMKLRAQVLEKGAYNFNKASFGSYKTFVPNRYEFGYNFVATAKKNFSGDVWERAIDKAGKLPVMIVPFNNGIKKVRGFNKVQLYKFCFKELDSLWLHQKNNTMPLRSVPIKTKNHKLYTSYNFTRYFKENSFITVRTGINDATRFVSIDSNGREHKVFRPGYFSNTSFSFESGRAVWAETSYDPRWENRTYSVIKIFNTQKKRAYQLTHRSRYFAPSLDRQGKKIVCVEQSITNRSSLIIMDAENGNVLQRFEADSADFIMTPSWSENGNKIVCIVLNRFGKRICMFDSSGQCQNITSPGFTEIAQPIMYRNHIFFIAVYSGINNIFSIDVRTKKVSQVTSSVYGVSDPVISENGNKLLYSDYTADGYKPVETDMDSARWISFEHISDNSVKLYQSTDSSKYHIIDFYSNDKKIYPVKRYSKFNLFNLHSWGPLSINADNTTVKPGIELLSQNLLSTMFFSLGYEHGWNKPQSQVYATMSYRGWYPVIDLQFIYQFNKDDTISWDVLALKAGIRVPLDLTKGKFNIFIQPRVNFSVYKLISKRNYPSDRFSGYYQALEYGFYGYCLLSTSLRDLNPRWGFLADFEYSHTPFSGAQLGDISAVQGMLLLPGIGKHHSLSIYSGYQQNLAGEHIFSDLISFPNGYDISGYKRAFSIKAAYQMPLFYPDWSIGSLLYIKRFRISLYFDHAYTLNKVNNDYSFSSAGAALIADFHFLRFLTPVSMGIRATYRFDNSEVIPEFVYSVNFDQLRFKRGFSRNIY